MKEIRICTLTHHTVPNYGAILQAYALQKAIKHIGYTSEILNYNSERVQYNYYLKFPKRKSLKNLISFFIRHPKFKKRNKLFKTFIENEIILSKKEYTRNTLIDANDQYDLFIVGSDQVWNLSINEGDTTYMLDFVNDKEKKGAYAASFGYSKIPDEYLNKTLCYLKDFNYLNVREKSGQQLIKEKLNIDANVTIDPTLLLNKEEWEKFTKKGNDKYILVYNLNKLQNIENAAKYLSKEENIKIIDINSYSTKIGPIDFINLFYNAQYVFTSSFHGMAFSIIFNKNFYFGIKETNKINSRITDLANILSLESRNVENFLETKKVTEIDYEIVNNKLSELRKSSNTILKNMIDDRKRKLNL